MLYIAFFSFKIYYLRNFREYIAIEWKVTDCSVIGFENRFKIHNENKHVRSLHFVFTVCEDMFLQSCGRTLGYMLGGK